MVRRLQAFDEKRGTRPEGSSTRQSSQKKWETFDKVIAECEFAESESLDLDGSSPPSDWMKRLDSGAMRCWPPAGPALEVQKRSFDEEYSGLRHVWDAHDHLSQINPSFFESGEQQEGANALLEKRPPDFLPWR
ncbi:MAG: hypothetical protein GEU71_00625 [Actinobacteria bacterium]|nr:hypothetical protein [Actinomycetota bacterium]